MIKETKGSILGLEMREVFQNQHDKLAKSKEYKVVMSHFGSFPKELVNGLSASAEGLLTSAGNPKKVVKRMFSILIEGLQNIRLHGAKDDQGNQLGFLIIASSKTNYQITMANVIQKNDYHRLEGYLEKINRFSEKELKDSYMSVLTNDFLSKKGGAGLGFITTRMKSENPLNHSFYALDDERMLFTFSVSLDR
ncbi:MAG: SiaB family protein kinase [Crocinitomicaceae bacterium]|nr:SiaB family protein kinase [Crocinitomicaceae bacterium]